MTFALSLENGTNLSTDRVDMVHVSQIIFIIYHNTYASESFSERSFLLSFISRCPIHTISNDTPQYTILNVRNDITSSCSACAHVHQLLFILIISYKVNESWILKSNILDFRVYLSYKWPLSNLSCKCYF